MPHQLVKQHAITIEGQPYPYTLRRSRRAKNILLHVDIHRGIEVVIPWRAAFRDAQAFVTTRSTWLKRILYKHDRLRAAMPRRQLISGELLPLCGEHYRLHVTVNESRRRTAVTTTPHRVTVHVSAKELRRAAIVRWYRRQARKYFITQCTALTQQLGLTFTKVSIGEPRTQWGSCSRQGRLSFNWRLVLAPAGIARYVAVHEVAHVLYPNHSPAFWQTVSQLDPNYLRHRQWLTSWGHTLVL